MKIILFYVSPSYPQLQRLLLLLKIQKKPTLQQVSGGNTPNIVLKRILRYFLKTPPLKKILQFQEKKLLSLLKTPKTTSSASFWLGNIKSSFKKNAKTFSKISTTQKTIRISRPKKRLQNLCEKKISNLKSNP